MMNYIGKGVLLNLLAKGSLHIASSMSAKIVSPADLGSTSRWHSLHCFILSSKIHCWTKWLLLYALVLTVASCFHTSLPVAFSSTTARLKISQNFSQKEPVVSHLIYNKIGVITVTCDLWGPTWPPAPALAPLFQLCSALQAFLLYLSPCCMLPLGPWLAPPFLIPVQMLPHPGCLDFVSYNITYPFPSSVTLCPLYPVSVFSLAFISTWHIHLFVYFTVTVFFY